MRRTGAEPGVGCCPPPRAEIAVGFLRLLQKDWSVSAVVNAEMVELFPSVENRFSR